MHHIPDGNCSWLHLGDSDSSGSLEIFPSLNHHPCSLDWSSVKSIVSASDRTANWNQKIKWIFCSGFRDVRTVQIYRLAAIQMTSLNRTPVSEMSHLGFHVAARGHMPASSFEWRISGTVYSKGPSIPPIVQIFVQSPGWEHKAGPWITYPNSFGVQLADGKERTNTKQHYFGMPHASNWRPESPRRGDSSGTDTIVRKNTHTHTYDVKNVFQ